MTEPQQPNPDVELLKVINRWHRTRWIAVGILAAILVVAAALGLRQLLVDQSRLAASCDFYRDLAAAPLPTPGGKLPNPSELGVKIVLDARSSWHGQGCPGSLPPPSPALRHWVAFYHLPGVLR